MSTLPDTIAGGIEDAAFLDPPANAATSLLHRLIPAGRLKDLLSGTALGHPAHPMLVTVPIGAWVSVSVLDLLGGKAGRDAARKLTAFGALAALPTAATGASDWSDTLGAERRVGLVHALGNYAALGVYGASYLARRRGRHTRRQVPRPDRSGAPLGHRLPGRPPVLCLRRGVDTTAFLAAPEDWT